MVAAQETLKLEQQVMLALVEVAQREPAQVVMELQIPAVAVAAAGATLQVETAAPVLLSFVIN